MIYGRLWESASGSMKYGPLKFTVVTHKDGAFYHHLEVGTLPSEFLFSSVLGSFIRDDEELEHSG